MHAIAENGNENRHLAEENKETMLLYVYIPYPILYSLHDTLLEVTFARNFAILFTPYFARLCIRVLDSQKLKRV